MCKYRFETLRFGFCVRRRATACTCDFQSYYKLTIQSCDHCPVSGPLGSNRCLQCFACFLPPQAICALHAQLQSVARKASIYPCPEQRVSWNASPAGPLLALNSHVECEQRYLLHSMMCLCFTIVDMSPCQTDFYCG